MGSVTYEFLADSFLFDTSNYENSFSDYSDSVIEKELVKYREHCIKNIDKLYNEIISNNSIFKVFSTIEDVSLNFLQQTALYIEQFIIDDPLFKLTDEPSEATNVTGKFLGYDEHKLDKLELVKVLKFLKTITPMVVDDYVKIFPISFYFEPPKQIPLNVPTDYNNDILPKEILDFFKEKAIVKLMVKNPNGRGWIIDESQKVSRGLYINFEGNLGNGSVYHLFESFIENMDDKTGVITYRHSLPDNLPELEHFKVWVQQSINQSAKEYFDKIFFENYLASKLNSSYLTNSTLSANLLNKNLDNRQTIQTFTAQELINMDLPFFENIDTVKLMQIRKYDADIFTNFRIELEKNFRELRTITDEKTLKLKKENIIHDLYNVQGQKITAKMDFIKKQIAINSTIAIGSLLSSFATSGLSLIGLAFAIGKGYKDYKDYIERVKENPCYFLWKIKKK